MELRTENESLRSQVREAEKNNASQLLDKVCPLGTYTDVHSLSLMLQAPTTLTLGIEELRQSLADSQNTANTLREEIERMKKDRENWQTFIKVRTGHTAVLIPFNP